MFFSTWSCMMSKSNRSRNKIRAKLGETPKRASVSRWWSRYESVAQVNAWGIGNVLDVIQECKTHGYATESVRVLEKFEFGELKSIGNTFTVGERVEFCVEQKSKERKQKKSAKLKRKIVKWLDGNITKIMDDGKTYTLVSRKGKGKKRTQFKVSSSKIRKLSRPTFNLGVLMLEIAVFSDIGKHLCTATYNVEEDGFIIVCTFSIIENLKNALTACLRKQVDAIESIVDQMDNWWSSRDESVEEDDDTKEERLQSWKNALRFHASEVKKSVHTYYMEMFGYVEPKPESRNLPHSKDGGIGMRLLRISEFASIFDPFRAVIEIDERGVRKVIDKCIRFVPHKFLISNEYASILKKEFFDRNGGFFSVMITSIDDDGVKWNNLDEISEKYTKQSKRTFVTKTGTQWELQQHIKRDFLGNVKERSRRIWVWYQTLLRNGTLQRFPTIKRTYCSRKHDNVTFHFRHSRY